MYEYRYNAQGIRFRIGERDWQALSHVRGLQSATLPCQLNYLTDRKIDKYVNSGFYEMRGEFLAEKKRKQEEKNLFPRLVYDTVTQNFI